MRPSLDLRLPKPRSRPFVTLAVSVAVHLVLLLVGAIEPWMPRLPSGPVTPPSVTVDTVPLVFLSPPRDEPPQRQPPLQPQREEPPRRTQAEPGTPAEPDRTPAVAQRPDPPIPEVPPPADTAAAPVTPTPVQPSPTGEQVAAGVGRIAPALGDAKLWVPPLPLPPRELAQRLSRTHVELVDSAVTAIVQNFLDSVAADPASRGTPLPDWTTRVGGKKFGIDSNSVYIAGLKIPAAVLALIPIPATGNIDQNRAYNTMLELRADIQQAARRSANLAEFKERIRAIRLRKEREEEFERRRREGPEMGQDSVVPRLPRPEEDEERQ